MKIFIVAAAAWAAGALLGYFVARLAHKHLRKRLRTLLPAGALTARKQTEKMKQILFRTRKTALPARSFPEFPRYPEFPKTVPQKLRMAAVSGKNPTISQK